MALFALPAAAQTPDGFTPSREGICDGLADATPGLQGLCVAMCEAQDCDAELDPETGEVVYDPSCSPSSPQLFSNYNKIATPADPPMPCVKVACPCWTEQNLDDVGGKKINGMSFDGCLAGDTFAGLWGSATSGGGSEFAYVLEDSRNGLMCMRYEADTGTFVQKPLSEAEYSLCRQNVIEECQSRGLVD